MWRRLFGRWKSKYKHSDDTVAPVGHANGVEVIEAVPDKPPKSIFASLVRRNTVTRMRRLL